MGPLALMNSRLAPLAALVFALAGCSGGDSVPAPGTPDASFARQGLAIPGVGPLTYATVAAHAATDGSGRLWVSGGTSEPGNAIFARLLADGTADSSFAVAGLQLSPANANTDPLFAAFGRAAFPDRRGGATLVEGAAAASCFSGPSCGPAGGFRIVTDALLRRVDESGQAIAAYGNGGGIGVMAESLLDATQDGASGVVLLIAPRRSVVEASPSNRVVRVDAEGRRDETFGSNAASALDCPGIPPGSAALARAAALPDGRVLVAQSFVALSPELPRLCLSRLGADGRPDPSFGTGGRAVLDDPSVPAGTVLNLLGLFANPDGSAEIAVSFLPGSFDASRPQFRVVAVSAAGRREDARFVPGAFSGSPLPVGLANAVAKDESGRYLVAGFPFGVQPFAILIEQPRLARFLPDGRLDESFGATGPGYTSLRFDSSAARLVPRHVHVANGAVVVAGSALFDDPRSAMRLAVARLSGR
jgi:uncharacterized delta-60 repeat protein